MGKKMLMVAIVAMDFLLMFSVLHFVAGMPTAITLVVVVIFTAVAVFSLQRAVARRKKRQIAAPQQIVEISDEAIKKQYSSIKKIGIAMVSSVFIYAIVVGLMKRYIQISFHENAPYHNIMRIGFLLYSIAQFFWLKVRKESKPASNTGSVLKRFEAMSIIMFAGCETVCIFGLILFMYAGQSIDFYSFFLLSLIYFWIYFPRYEQMEKWVKMQPQSLH
ncbi:MAG: hypothetical protein ACYDFU_03185 [Nitrospirota bacterium]